MIANLFSLDTWVSILSPLFIVPSNTLTSSKCWPFGALMTFVTSNLHLSFFKYPESDTWPPLSA